MNANQQPSNCPPRAQAAYFDPFAELEAKDYLYALNLDFDLDAQLIAIHGVLHRNRNAEVEIAEEIKKIEEHTRHLKGMHAEWAEQDWIDRVHVAGFQDTAHSMAAVGMLAPLVETIFHQCFRAIGSHLFPPDQPVQDHERWSASHALRWDCRWAISGNRPERNVVRGIFQLSDAIGLTSRLPLQWKETLSALFAYRNNMFHDGFEWPQEDRERFAKRMLEEKWPAEWFFSATRNEEPWMFCLTTAFVEHCLVTVDGILVGIGMFVRETCVGGTS